jgi:hypothetical protein
MSLKCKPAWGSWLYIHAACPCRCPCCMSMPHVHATCPC